MLKRYIKAPAAGKTTAAIIDQEYVRAARRTFQYAVASFNLAADPSRLPVGITITPTGQARGVHIAHIDKLEVERYLRQNGTFGQVKVPADVLAQARAIAEAELRTSFEAEFAERLDAAKCAAAAQPMSAPASIGEKISAMLAAVDAVKNHLKSMPEGAAATLNPSQVSDWRMSSFAFSETLNMARDHGQGRPKSWQSQDWSAEALERGYITQATVQQSRHTVDRAAAKAKKSVE
jgi:hypothetical protein